MTLFAQQTAQAGRDVARMIRLSGVHALLSRSEIGGEGSFFGPRDTNEWEIGTIPIEMKQLPPADLAEIGADAVASVLPDCGVAEQDFLQVAGVRYRVTEVKPHNLFGTTTHVDLHLEREKRGPADG